jgi:hypothetical protein
VRLATLLVAVIALGLISNHVAESALVMLGAAFTLAIDETRTKGTRTCVMLPVSILYASIFAIGVVISISDYLVVPLLVIGLFMISYFTAYPRALTILQFADYIFVVAIATQGDTISLAVPAFLLVFASGLWGVVAYMFGSILAALFVNIWSYKLNRPTREYVDNCRESRGQLYKQRFVTLQTEVYEGNKNMY